MYASLPSFSSSIMLHSYLLVAILFSCCTIDCAVSEIIKDYGSNYNFSIHEDAYSLDFSKSLDGPQVLLWNRTANSRLERGVRGTLVDNKWMMDRLTQEDNGYYTFRDEMQRIMSRHQVTIKEIRHSKEKVEGQALQVVDLPTMTRSDFDLTFNQASGPKTQLVMKAGEVQQGHIFTDRIEFFQPGLKLIVMDLKEGESGSFKLTDQKDNLALVMELTVHTKDPPVPVIIYAAVGVVLVLLVPAGWCLYKCYKKRQRRKHENAVTTQRATSAEHHPLAEASAAPHGPEDLDALSSDAGAPV